MNLGMPEMIFIFLMALLIFGPRKLPEVGRQIGKALAEFKRASNTFRSQLDLEMRNLELEETAKKPAAPSIRPPERTIATEPGVPPGVDPDAYRASEASTPQFANSDTQFPEPDAQVANSDTQLASDNQLAPESATPPADAPVVPAGDATASAKAADA